MFSREFPQRVLAKTKETLQPSSACEAHAIMMTNESAETRVLHLIDYLIGRSDDTTMAAINAVRRLEPSCPTSPAAFLSWIVSFIQAKAIDMADVRQMASSLRQQVKALKSELFELEAPEDHGTVNEFTSLLTNVKQTSQKRQQTAADKQDSPTESLTAENWLLKMKLLDAESHIPSLTIEYSSLRNQFDKQAKPEQTLQNLESQLSLRKETGNRSTADTNG
jgi:hypothetical protein